MIKDCCAEEPKKRLTAKEVEARLKASCEYLLMDAVQQNKFKEVDRFLKAGFSPDIEAKDPNISFAAPLLHIAIQANHVNLVKLLLERKADVNKCDSEEKTPLYIAAKEGMKNTASLLLKAKADTYKMCGKPQPKTPFDVAEEKGHTGLMEVLRQWQKYGLLSEKTLALESGSMVEDEKKSTHSVSSKGLSKKKKAPVRTKNRRSEIDKTKLITPDSWVLSLARKADRGNIQHVFIII